jgi:hypothetical protein
MAKTSENPRTNKAVAATTRLRGGWGVRTTGTAVTTAVLPAERLVVAAAWISSPASGVVVVPAPAMPVI